MKVYLGRLIHGFSSKSVMSYYNRIQPLISKMGYTVLSPMTAKKFANNHVFKPTGYAQPSATDHAITRRDHWMVCQSDVVFMNLLGAENASIGCVAELAWAYHLNKHTVVIMKENNPHQHAFILEMSDVIFKTEKEGLDYLDKLIRKEV